MPSHVNASNLCRLGIKSIKMEKRSRPSQGYYKNPTTTSISCARLKWDRKQEVLCLFEAERIVARKVHDGKSFYMVKWHGYCASQNTWELKVHLPTELIKTFDFPDPEPEEAWERIGLIFERELKVPLQYEELIEICHDVARLLFPNLPAEIQVSPVDISNKDWSSELSVSTVTDASSCRLPPACH